MKIALLAGLLALAGCNTAFGVIESWSSAQPGIYIPHESDPIQISGDSGAWLVADTASNFPEDGPTPNKAEIISAGNDRHLKLTSRSGASGVAENIWVVRHRLFDPISIPLDSGKKISVIQSGSLDDPNWSGYRPSGGSPNCTCVYLMLEDNRGNILVYLFQRAANYPSHTKTLQGYDSGGNLVSIGYHEILLGSPNADGGTYVRNVFEDFSQVPGFNAAGASIAQVTYELTHPGTTTLQRFEIDNQLTPLAPAVSTQPATMVTSSAATLNGTVNPNGSNSTAYFEYGITTGYGNVVPVVLSPSDGASDQPLGAPIADLASGQTYHYRLSATNTAGTIHGDDMTFETSTPPIDPGELIAPQITRVGEEFEFSVHLSVPGRRYQLQYSKTLEKISWKNVGDVRIGDGERLDFTISREPEDPCGFYRLALDP